MWGIEVDEVWPLTSADEAALAEIKDMFRERPLPADLLEARQSLADLTSRAPLAEEVEVRPTTLGGIPCERNLPPGRRDGVVFFLHGGAYVMGSPATHRHYTTRLARESGCEVISPDYRLAPEDPHPAAVEDSVAAYRALLESHASSEITLVGESAGGGLAVGVLHTLIDRGLPLPARYALINPWLDLTCSTPAYARNAKADFSLQREDLLRAAKAYLDRPALDDKVVFPLIAPPRGFPPGLILVGGNDLLVDDSLIFASLARSCGVDVRIIVLESMPHVWPALVKQLECSRAGLAAVSRFVVAGAS
ncbi:MAG: alpha/beta hydrolase [Candidatus Competibacterales bacterium]|nr:alpha/beta hydrolase [Candidatus Competibacterales bacterium]